MRIKLNNDQIFVAEEVPWFIAIMLVFFMFCFIAPGLAMAADGVWQGLLFGLFGGGLGFAALCVFVERLQVILDRREGLITLRRRTVLSYSETQLPLENLLRAEVESTISRKDGRSRRLYRPSLVLQDSDGEAVHPITQVYSNGGRTKQLVDAINKWIKTASPPV